MDSINHRGDIIVLQPIILTGQGFALFTATHE